MATANALLKQLYESIKNYDNAHNEFRRNPSDKAYELYEKAERKLMFVEQRVQEYLDENNIKYKINL